MDRVKFIIQSSESFSFADLQSVLDCEVSFDLAIGKPIIAIYIDSLPDIVEKAGCCVCILPKDQGPYQTLVFGDPTPLAIPW